MQDNAVAVMEVAGVKAQPGTLARGSIEVVELADGTKISMPLIYQRREAGAEALHWRGDSR